MNGLYFSTFEFKRASRLLSRFHTAPPNLAARLDALFETDELTSTAELERLVSEVGALVTSRFPSIDLSLTWGEHGTPPGSREAGWERNG